ncbi:MAG: hypothetical protein O9252_01740, partial [Algoriphagus sp.]|nr:hypothetical protein [Algoriphagus sp.]
MENPESIKDLTLDPENWDQMRELGHQMIDDLFDYWQSIRDQKIWKPIPAEVKDFLDQPIPETGQDPNEVYEDFKKYIFPYNKGNVHPRFF